MQRAQRAHRARASVAEMHSVRPVGKGDIDAVLAIHGSAFGLEPGANQAFFRARFEHLLRTDPEGAFACVATDGSLSGVAFAMRRDGLWGLSLLAVAPAAQGAGVGSALIEHALGYAQDSDARIILSSEDPRGQQLYARTGHAPRATLDARGNVAPRARVEVAGVRAGERAALALCDRIDRASRGFSRLPELEFFARQDGLRFWIVEDRQGSGYAIGTPERLVTLSATSESVARDLLAHVLSQSGRGEFAVGFVAETQHWAQEILAGAGLELVTRGPIWTHGAVGPLANYIPNGALL